MTNIDTCLHKALTGVMSKVFAGNPGGFDPRRNLAPRVDTMPAVGKDQFERFGAVGVAGKIVPVARSYMANRYASSNMALAL